MRSLGIINTFLNDFLSENRGMSVEKATFWMMVFGAGNFCGLLLGGYGGGWLYRRDKRYPSLLAGIAAILACFPMWVLLNMVDNDSSIFFTGPVTLFAGLCSGMQGPVVKTIMQNVTFPRMRGQALALFNTFDDFGRGLGPVFVAVMITRFGGRTPAFNVGVSSWMVCGAMISSTYFTIKHDEDRVQTLIAESLPPTREASDTVASPPCVPDADEVPTQQEDCLPQPSLTTVRQRSRESVT